MTSQGGAQRARIAAIAAVLLVIGAGCADDGKTEAGAPPPGGAGPSAGPGAGQIETRYALVADPAWQLREAIDYRGGLGPLGEGDPDLDWYAEYEGPRTDHDDGSYTIPHLATFGHVARLERRRDQLPGFDFKADTIGGRRALIADAVPPNPAIVVIELASDYTATLLTYDHGVDLRDLAVGLAPATEQQWVEAGGAMLDCVPFDPGCTSAG